jgi:hypothetical protein
VNFRFCKVNFRSVQVCSRISRKNELLRKVNFRGAQSELHIAQILIADFRKWTSKKKVNFWWGTRWTSNRFKYVHIFLGELNFSIKMNSSKAQSELWIFYKKWSSIRFKYVLEFLEKMNFWEKWTSAGHKVNFNFYKVNFKSLHVSSQFSGKCKLPKKVNFGASQLTEQSCLSSPKLISKSWKCSYTVGIRWQRVVHSRSHTVDFVVEFGDEWRLPARWTAGSSAVGYCEPGQWQVATVAGRVRKHYFLG